MIASENLTARQGSILKKVCCEIVAKSRVAPFMRFGQVATSIINPDHGIM
jgi:hypothetical protein